MTEVEESERRSRLVGVKLRALAREHLGRDVGEPATFAPGAALLDGPDAWVYLDRDPEQRLGAALAWMVRSGAERLQIVVDGDGSGGVLARRALAFRTPITVWQTDERVLSAVDAEPIVPSAPAPAHHEELRSLIVGGGADPIVEHGVLAGEVRGLEVCRVVDDPALDITRLEVGVGEHDREAFQMLHGDVPAAESLARVVESVSRHRAPDAPPHPLKALGAERLLRWRLEQQPQVVDATILAPAPPPVPRRNLKDPVPCVASGLGDDGRPVIVVCSTGIDLDVIPYAADARLALGETGVGGGRMVVAMPTRDRIDLVEEISNLLDEPAEIVPVD